MGIYKPKGSSLVVPAGGSLESVILSTQAASLMGYYKCDDASGDLVDSSGHGLDIQAFGSGHTYGVTGHIGDAVQTNGTGGWSNGETAGTRTMNPINGFTMLALLNNASGIDSNEIFSFGHGDFNRQVRMVGSNISNGFNLRSLGNAVSSNSIINSFTAFSDTGNWHHVGFRGRTAAQGATGGVGGPDDLDRIVDGVITNLDTTTWTNTTLDAVGVLMTYINVDAGSYWSGPIQHVAFWNTPLTDSEISNIFDATGL